MSSAVITMGLKVLGGGSSLKVRTSNKDIPTKPPTSSNTSGSSLGKAKGAALLGERPLACWMASSMVTSMSGLRLSFGVDENDNALVKRSAKPW